MVLGRVARVFSFFFLLSSLSQLVSEDFFRENPANPRIYLAKVEGTRDASFAHAATR